MNTLEAVELARLGRYLAETNELDQTVQRVVKYARHVTGAQEGGLVVLKPTPRLEVTWGERAEQADRLQETLQEGPAVHASRPHEACLVLVRDIVRDDRWPRWSAAVANLGLNSAVIACLCTSRGTVGTLSVYSAAPDGLNEQDAERVQILASHAAVAINAIREEDGLRRAMATRNVIGQAQGLLMERYNLDARRAFEVLRRFSQERNVKLCDVAKQLVRTRDLPSRSDRSDRFDAVPARRQPAPSVPAH